MTKTAQPTTVDRLLAHTRKTIRSVNSATTRTMMQDLYVKLEANRIANGGQLVPLTVRSTLAAKREETVPDCTLTKDDLTEYFRAINQLGKAIAAKDFQTACDTWDCMSPLHRQIVTSEAGHTLLAAFGIHTDSLKGEHREDKARD
jgi:hypothetical protein